MVATVDKAALDGAAMYELALLSCAATLLALWLLTRAPLGRTFLGIRENEGRMCALLGGGACAVFR